MFKRLRSNLLDTIASLVIGCCVIIAACMVALFVIFGIAGLTT